VLRLVDLVLHAGWLRFLTTAVGSWRFVLFL
jgi:hypothetical protein